MYFKIIKYIILVVKQMYMCAFAHLRLTQAKEVIFLEDMIARIVSMDKKARSMTDDAQKSKVNSEKEILTAKEKIKTDYLERAKERVRVNSQTAQKKADDQLAGIEKANAVIIAALDKAYEEKGNQWADEIVRRVIADE